MCSFFLVEKRTSSVVAEFILWPSLRVREKKILTVVDTDTFGRQEGVLSDIGRGSNETFINI